MKDLIIYVGPTLLLFVLEFLLVGFKGVMIGFVFWSAGYLFCQWTEIKKRQVDEVLRNFEGSDS